MDTKPPRPSLAFAEPSVLSPGVSGTERLVEIAYRGPKNAAPEYRVFRTDDGPPRVVLRFRGGDAKSAFWDGRLRGRIAPDGNYAFSVRVRDRAGNAGLGPPGDAGPTAATALAGTGVVVRRLTLRGPLGVVGAGQTASFEVGPHGGGSSGSPSRGSAGPRCSGRAAAAGGASASAFRRAPRRAFTCCGSGRATTAPRCRWRCRRAWPAASRWWCCRRSPGRA